MRIVFQFWIRQDLIHPQMEERYVYKMVKTLPKETGKMHFVLDSCTGG